MAQIKTTGLGIALITPFHENGEIDFAALENLIEYVIVGGADYIVALGTTSEVPTLSLEEKILLIDFIREKTDGRVQLVIGIGSNNTREVVNQIKAFNLNGYSAILSVTPYYNKPSQEGLYRHYMSIADNSSLPLILYNVPGRTGVNLSARTTIELAKHPSIAAIKEASGNLDQIREIIEKKPEDFIVISGDDSAIYPIMKMGGSGVISVLGNAFPAKIKHLVELCRMGNWAVAEAEQSAMKPLTRHVFEDGNPSGIKFALSAMGKIRNVLRLPLVPVSHSTGSNILKEMENLR